MSAGGFGGDGGKEGAGDCRLKGGAHLHVARSEAEKVLVERVLEWLRQLKSSVEADVKEVGDSFPDPEDRESPPASSPSATNASPGAKGASEEPAAKKQRVTFLLERKRAERLPKAKGAAATTAVEALRAEPAPSKELATYLAEKVEPEEDDFPLLGFWLRKNSPITCAETG